MQMMQSKSSRIVLQFQVLGSAQNKQVKFSKMFLKSFLLY